MSTSTPLLFILIICLLASACKSDSGDPQPTPPVVSKTIKVGQQETETGYTLEMNIPWKTVGLSATAGLDFGFELFLIDDDNGGRKDGKLSWHTKPGTDETPIPAKFGTLRLVNEAIGLDSLSIPFTSENIFINGVAESFWDGAPVFPIEHLVGGTVAQSSDFSGHFRALWDTASLFLYVSIQDDSLAVDSRTLTWEDDGIAVYLDPTMAREPEFNLGVTFGYRILRDRNEVVEDDFLIAPNWTVPILDVYDGGTGQDGIPALEMPGFISAQEATYLSQEALVLGYVNGGTARAYPHEILDWHEIVNDEVNSFAYTITYCPLTGSALGWDRTIAGVATTFGVSGFLYNNNLIPYDRQTGSNWSQMGIDCLSGANQGRRIHTFQLIETTWKTWKELFPNTEVLSRETGHDRNYARYPYDDYRTNNDAIIFPLQPDDSRLPRKTRVHGIIVNNQAKIYQFSKFTNSATGVVHDEFQGVPIVLAGSSTRNFIVSYERILTDGTKLTFYPDSDPNDPSVIMRDQEGGFWNILGQAVSGPRTGTQLLPTESFSSYWFAIGAFYPGAEIY